jgi:hypothetical protein
MRPLTLEQLRFAYAIKEDMIDLNPKQHLPFFDCINETVGLLVVDPESNTVRFTHSTFKDYLNHAREAGNDEKTGKMAIQWLLSERMHQVHIVREKIQRYHFLSCVQPLSPLCEACYFGLCVHVMKLLDLRHDINVVDSNGMGPLYCAVWNNRLGVVQLLFEFKNLDVNVKTMDGIMPLHAASQLSHIDLVRLFLQFSRVRTVKVNVQDTHGWMALIGAAKSGYTDIVDLLLQHADIDINVQDKDGWIALTMAVDGGHAGIVRRLLSTDTLTWQHQE